MELWAEWCVVILLRAVKERRIKIIEDLAAASNP
jgi:hypothetical protein